MAWWRPSASIRSVSIAMIVTAVHVVLAVILLSQKLAPMAPLTPAVLEIELAELAPEIESLPEPIVPVLDPAPIVTEETPQLALSPPEPSSPPPSDPAPTPEAHPVDSQRVLTQMDKAPSGLAPTQSGSAPTETPTGEISGDPVTPAQIASALKKMNCLKLKRHEEGACQPTDPFAAAMANAKRAKPPERLFEDTPYIYKSVSDKLFEREAAERFNWPDEDLFADPMGEGAYNAWRIRNGQEPLWSKEMRDGFRKSDD